MAGRLRRQQFVILPVLVLVGAVVLATAGHRSPASATAPASSPATSVPAACKDKGPVPASALRVPEQNCRLTGRTVTYEGAKVSVPATGKKACGETVRDRTRFTVCAVDDDAVYAVTSRVSLPMACTQTGAIKASLLRVPVLDSLCDLQKRRVEFDGVGVYVPRNGTTCGVATKTTEDISLCVTRDTTAVYAIASAT